MITGEKEPFSRANKFVNAGVHKKRPEPNIGSGRTKSCPWFHLNSPLEAGHFIPGNGGVRRSISAPQLQGAIPRSPEELAPTAPSLRPENQGLPCHSFLPGHCSTVLHRCQGKPPKSHKFPGICRRKAGSFPQCGNKSGKLGLNCLLKKPLRQMAERFSGFTSFRGQRPR